MICISIQKKLHLQNLKVSVKELNESFSQNKGIASEREHLSTVEVNHREMPVSESGNYS